MSIARMRADYIRKIIIPGLIWEEKERGEDGAQLVSTLIASEDKANNLLDVIIENESLKNKTEKIYTVVKSRSAEGFRICVELSAYQTPFERLKEQKANSQLERIVNFLNEVHAPFVKNHGVQCQWKIERGLVVCQGPSIRYGRPKDGELPGEKVKQILRTHFSQKAIVAGFDEAFILEFDRYLISEEHKHGCFHHFADPTFINILDNLAKKYNTKCAAGYIKGAAVGALPKTKLPVDISKNVLSLFFTIGDAEKLARVNRAAAESVRKFDLKK